MKDENIKEILEDVKRHLDYVEATKQASIRDNEMKAMYEYITNLQDRIKELEKYKNIVDELERYFIDMFNRTQDTKYLDDLQKIKN